MTTMTVVTAAALRRRIAPRATASTAATASSAAVPATTRTSVSAAHRVARSRPGCARWPARRAETAMAAATRPTTKVTAASTMALAASTWPRLGLATRVVRIRPRRYSAVMNMVPDPITTISPANVPVSVSRDGDAAVRRSAPRDVRRRCHRTQVMVKSRRWSGDGRPGSQRVLSVRANVRAAAKGPWASGPAGRSGRRCAVARLGPAWPLRPPRLALAVCPPGAAVNSPARTVHGQPGERGGPDRGPARPVGRVVPGDRGRRPGSAAASAGWPPETAPGKPRPVLSVVVLHPHAVRAG